MKHKIEFAPSYELLSEKEKIEANKIVDLLGKAMDEYYEGNPFGFVKI